TRRARIAAHPRRDHDRHNSQSVYTIHNNEARVSRASLDCFLRLASCESQLTKNISTILIRGSSRTIRPFSKTRDQSRGRRGKRASEEPGNGCTRFCKPGGSVPLRCSCFSRPGGRRSFFASPGGKPARWSTKQLSRI